MSNRFKVRRDGDSHDFLWEVINPEGDTANWFVHWSNAVYAAHHYATRRLVHEANRSSRG